MKKLLVTVALVMLVLTAVNARQIQSNAPRDMNSMMQMMEMRQMMDKCLMNMTDVDISVADTKNGVSLTLTPKDPSQLETLRKNVRTHADMMQKGECGMHGTMNNPHDH